MKIGDTIVLKEDYNLAISFGNVEFNLAGGAKGVIVQIDDTQIINGFVPSAKVAFNLNKFITVTAIIDRGAFSISK